VSASQQQRSTIFMFHVKRRRQLADVVDVPPGREPVDLRNGDPGIMKSRFPAITVRGEKKGQAPSMAEG
jgi:hypothetical protein